MLRWAFCICFSFVYFIFLVKIMTISILFMRKCILQGFYWILSDFIQLNMQYTSICWAKFWVKSNLWIDSNGICVDQVKIVSLQKSKIFNRLAISAIHSNDLRAWILFLNSFKRLFFFYYFLHTNVCASWLLSMW